jgi:hypothetical protein
MEELDGTRNIKAQLSDLLDDYVWVGDEMDQPWMKGGSYMVTRPHPDVYRKQEPGLSGGSTECDRAGLSHRSVTEWRK